ncbi:MAG: metallophosphoesterase [Oscillospiraceae bacterium]|nr:metallophosphoesterase [Oscillospiraceae bacterium]
MRILILSDSHGNVKNMKLAAERTKPDQIIHLGDHFRDGEALKEAFPLLPVAQVIGNCDLYDFSAREGKDQLLLTLDGHRTLLTHGHRYHVKSSLLSLSYAAREVEAELCLFGHTHIPHLQQLDGLTLLNPGSIGNGDFAVAETGDGKLRCALLTL